MNPLPMGSHLASDFGVTSDEAPTSCTSRPGSPVRLVQSHVSSVLGPAPSDFGFLVSLSRPGPYLCLWHRASKLRSRFSDRSWYRAGSSQEMNGVLCCYGVWTANLMQRRFVGKGNCRGGSLRGEPGVPRSWETARLIYGAEVFFGWGYVSRQASWVWASAVQGVRFCQERDAFPIIHVFIKSGRHKELYSSVLIAPKDTGSGHPTAAPHRSRSAGQP